MFSHLRQDILGVSSPQLYLKVGGVWTGGHEENLRAQAVNINFGPAPSKWYCVKAEHVPRLRRLVKAKYGEDKDIHAMEGLWFEDIDFFLENNVPISMFYQEAGDCVLHVSRLLIVC
jgi:histone demethylase